MPAAPQDVYPQLPVNDLHHLDAAFDPSSIRQAYLQHQNFPGASVYATPDALLRRSSASRDTSSGRPIKRRQIKSGVSQRLQTAEDFELARAIDEPSTGQYRNFFNSLDESRASMARLLELHRKDKRDCTFRDTDDPTFPSSNAIWVAYVRKIVDAINDWSQYQEWVQVVSTEDRDRIAAQTAGWPSGTIRGRRPTDAELVGMLPPMEEQQKKILGTRGLSDMITEQLSWGLAVCTVTFVW